MWSDTPVFIITCVVARFTFFLNPVADQYMAPPNAGWFCLPAHDILTVVAVREVYVMGVLGRITDPRGNAKMLLGSAGGESVEDGGFEV